MRRANRFLRLAAPALALVISACATAPGPTSTGGASPQPPADEAEPPEPLTTEPPVSGSERPRPPAPEPCAWTEVRGIATLLAVTGQSGTWQFVPGDDVLFHSVPAGARPEDEFKALLRRPLRGPCPDPRLILFDPV